MRAQALLLAWKGSGCKLNGPTVGVTDEQGHVHFDLSFASGSSGSYLLLFGSEATFAFGGIADVVDALRTTAISIGEQVAQAGQAALTSVAGSLASSAASAASTARAAATDVTGGLRGSARGALAGASRRHTSRSAIRMHAERGEHHRRAMEAVALRAHRVSVPRRSTPPLGAPPAASPYQTEDKGRRPSRRSPAGPAPVPGDA